MATPPDARPERSQQLREYLDWLCRQLRVLKDVDALSGDPVHQFQLQVPAVFVPQMVRREMPLVSPPREIEVRFGAGQPVSEHDLPPDLDSDRLNRDLKEYAARRPQPVFEVLAEVQRLTLLGSPGAGKTTLAKYLGLTLADPATWPPPAELNPFVTAGNYIPFVAELRSYPQHAALNSFIDVIDALAGDGCPVSAKSLLESCINGRGNALVIFDGLDEVFDRSLRNRLKVRISEFARLNDGLRVVVTSRLSGYSRQELDAGGFTHYTLDHFGPDEVAEFADRFYRALEPSPARAKVLTARLLTSVQAEGSSPMAEFAGNPLLLTTLAFLARSGEVPTSRLEALRQATELLAQDWDAARDLQPPSGYGELSQISKRDKLELIGRVARRIMATNDPQGPRNYLSGTDLTKLIAAYLHHELEHSRGEADVIAERMVTQLRDRDYILAKFQNDAYGFVHRAFLDYLAAADIAAQRLGRDQITALFLSRWRQPAWRGVLSLLAGLLPPEDVEQAIVSILRSDRLWYLNPDPQPWHVLLAVRCLAEVRQRGRFRDASRAIAAAIIALLELACQPTDYGIGEVVARVLDRDVLPVLAELPGEWAGRPHYEHWYLARGQFLHGVRVGDSQAVAARLYVALLGRDDSARKRLHALALGARSTAVRGASAEALTANWPEDIETLGLLRALAIDAGQPVYVQHQALRALAAHAPTDDPEVRDLLVGCAQTGATEVRGIAVQSLATDWRDVDTVDLLRGIGAGIGEDDPGVRAVAVRGLAEAWRTDPDVLAWLWERTAGTEPVRVRVAAVQALAAHWGGDPDVLPWLEGHAREADEPEYQVRLAAVRALAACWPELTRTADLLEAKAQAGGDSASDVRQAAVEALALGQRNERTAVLLRRLTAEDPSSKVRAAAMRALVTNWADQPATVATIERLLIGHPDRDPFVLAGAATALADLRPDDPQVTARLYELAELDRRADVRAAALRALAAHHQANPEMAAWLTERSSCDRAAWVRGVAVEVLADGWHDDDDTLARLRAVGCRPTTGQAEIDRDAVARRVAARSVAAGWPTDIGTYRWLLKRAANDEHQGPSEAALELLAANEEWRARPETIAALRTAAAAAGHPQTRETAIHVLAAIEQGGNPVASDGGSPVISRSPNGQPQTTALSPARARPPGPG